MKNKNSDILMLCSQIYEKLGEIKVRYPVLIPTNLHRAYRAESIVATMKLEGQALSETRTQALIKNNLVRGPQHLIRETEAIINIFKVIKRIDPWTQVSLKRVHRELISDIFENPGEYREEIGMLFRGTELIKMAPVPESVPGHMYELFDYLNNGDDPIVIKSCMAHYTIESIQPFEFGNGKMGRLWQTILLMQEHQLFELLPWENLVLKKRRAYFKSLTTSNEAGDSRTFITYMLHILDESLETFISSIPRKVTESDRILNFYELGMQSFTRKDYMGIFKHISSATASRDLEKGVNAGLFQKTGTKSTTLYSCQKP